MEPPQNPAGAFVPEENLTSERRAELIAEIDSAPCALQGAVNGLSNAQLDTRYRNWTVRQIVHHLADSHVNVYVRFKLALTEDVPTIKPYDESRWSALPDSRLGDIQLPMSLLKCIHASWVQLMGAMTPEQFDRTFYHPELGKIVSLNEAVCSYAWHCRHHTAQIMWLRQNRGW